jgi:DNA processing protein
MMIYKIALTMVPGIGGILGKKLVNACGSAEAIFREKKTNLMKIRGIGEVAVAGLSDRNLFDKAEKELEFITKYQIKALFFDEDQYPVRLKHCPDGPLLIYYKGTDVLSSKKILGVVGTRKPSLYGKEKCREIISQLDKDILIISGLAYGIDTVAHHAALERELATVGVLAHGLDLIYPWMNKSLAEKMIRQGGLLTEEPSGTRLNRDLFPKRNRIIAGLSDAVLVIESGLTGGAMITADIASSYDRDVFALPGRSGDKTSEGPNFLIKQNKAALIETADDINKLLGWTDHTVDRQIKLDFLLNLDEEESKVMQCLAKDKAINIEEIYLNTGIQLNRLTSILLNFEFEGIVKAYPGRMYKLL